MDKKISDIVSRLETEANKFRTTAEQTGNEEVKQAYYAAAMNIAGVAQEVQGESQPNKAEQDQQNQKNTSTAASSSSTTARASSANTPPTTASTSTK